MPLHLSSQNGQAIHPAMTGSQAEKAVMAGVISVAIRKNGSNWEENLFSGAGWTPKGAITEYKPPIPVRFINICDASESTRRLVYDQAGYMVSGNENANSFGCEELLPTNTFLQLHVTKVTLNTVTTATEIHFHG